jgi:uncharacterized integral membrane protein
MASEEHEPVMSERTRTSSTMVAVTVAVIFLVLLIVFIAQNNRKVPVHFLWMQGSVSESIALVMSAIAGAVFVLAIGIARIVQLRLEGRRHNRAMKQQEMGGRRGASAPAAAQGGAQPVEPKH